MYNYLTYEVNVRLLFVRVEDYIYILEEEMRKTIMMQLKQFDKKGAGHMGEALASSTGIFK